MYRSNAADKLTHSVALGNSYKSGKHSVYLDLSYSHMAADLRHYGI